MNLNITGYSTALFSTWYFIEEAGLLFDAGEGLTAALMQKSRKINNVFISHADRDHLGGLLQFTQLNARPGLPQIHFPKDCGSFPALEKFLINFDPHVAGTVWKPITGNETIPVKDGLEVDSLINNHVPAVNGAIKSLSYKVFTTKTKLRAEFAMLSPGQIKEIVFLKGKEAVSETVRTNILSYSGDTPVEDYAVWDNAEVLIHESTFLDPSVQEVKPRGNRHSTLEEVMRMVSEIRVGTLILGHFSSRYSQSEIDSSIQKLYKKYNLKIPVHRILPGQTVFNILSGNPVCG